MQKTCKLFQNRHPNDQFTVSNLFPINTSLKPKLQSPQKQQKIIHTHKNKTQFVKLKEIQFHVHEIEEPLGGWNWRC